MVTMLNDCASTADFIVKQFGKSRLLSCVIFLELNTVASL